MKERGERKGNGREGKREGGRKEGRKEEKEGDGEQKGERERVLWSASFGGHWRKEIQKFFFCGIFIRFFILLI